MAQTRLLQSTGVAKAILTANLITAGMFGGTNGSTIGIVNAIREMATEGVTSSADSGKTQTGNPRGVDGWRDHPEPRRHRL
jgi:hypothetical protein